MESVKNSIKEEESDPSTEFVTLYELLERNVPHSEIATVIEKKGICGWDRYGRFHDVTQTGKPNPTIVNDALEELAKDYAWVRKVRYPDEREPRDVHYGEETRLLSFGWPAQIASKHINLQAHSNFNFDIPKYSRKERNNLLNIIETLLEILVKKNPEISLENQFGSEAKLIAFIEEKFDEVSGISRGNLIDVFSEAKAIR